MSGLVRGTVCTSLGVAFGLSLVSGLVLVWTGDPMFVLYAGLATPMTLAGLWGGLLGLALGR